MFERFIKWILTDSEIDSLRVKHLEITSMNTLSTPKLVLTEVGANPAANGELKMNTGTVKGQNSSDGVRLF